MTEKRPSKAALKKAESQRFYKFVESVLDEARAAAKAAANEFVEKANCNRDRHELEQCGSGYIVMYKPSYRLREALKSLEEARRDYDGAWHVSDFGAEAGSQSVVAQELACKAACSVLKKAFPGEGEFYTNTWVN